MHAFSRWAFGPLFRQFTRVRRTLRDGWVRGEVLGVRFKLLKLRADVLYSNLATLVERHGAICPDLTRYELKVFSQNGEDGVIAEIIRRIGVTTCSFVEFGIEDGSEGNCLFLADVLGWSGTFIEGDLGLHARLSAKYITRDDINTLCHWVTVENINEILSSSCTDKNIDILSIDIDGNDYWIWKAIDVIDPRIVIIEYNGSIDLRSSLVQPYEPSTEWNSASFFGASLTALTRLGLRKGYVLIHTELAGVNAFFVKAELAHHFTAPGGSPRRAANYWLGGTSHAVGETESSYIEVDENGDESI